MQQNQDKQNKTKHGVGQEACTNPEVSLQVTDSVDGGFGMNTSRRFSPRISFRSMQACYNLFSLAGCYPAAHSGRHSASFNFKYRNLILAATVRTEQIFDCLHNAVLQYYFTVTFNHDNQKALELRTEDVKDCDEWVAAITQARYALMHDILPAYVAGAEKLNVSRTCLCVSLVSCDLYRIHAHRLLGSRDGVIEI